MVCEMMNAKTTSARIRASRLYTDVTVQLRTFLRDPLNAVLVLVLPVLVILGFGRAMATFPETPAMRTLPADSGRMFGALFSTAFLSGIFGLHQSIDARTADQRLILAGYSSSTLLLSRLVTILVVTLVGAGLSYAVTVFYVTPSAPVFAFFFLFIGGLVYALVGILTGAIVPRLFEGSLLVLFIADMDAFLGSGMAKTNTKTEFLPLHYPYRLFQSAMTQGSYNLDNLLYAFIYVFILAFLVYFSFARVHRVGEDNR